MDLLKTFRCHLRSDLKMEILMWCLLEQIVKADLWRIMGTGMKRKTSDVIDTRIVWLLGNCMILGFLDCIKYSLILNLNQMMATFRIMASKWIACINRYCLLENLVEFRTALQHLTTKPCPIRSRHDDKAQTRPWSVLCFRLVHKNIPFNIRLKP